MLKGILFGLIAQVAFAIGFVFISQVTQIQNQLLKACLNLCISAVFTCAVVGYFYFVNAENLTVLSRKSLWLLGIGSLLVLVVGDTFFIAGISASNVNTVAYTSLARPAIALLLEFILGKVTLTLRDLIGFVLLAAGFIVISTR